MDFNDTSTAGSTIATSFNVFFKANSTAGSAIITVNDGGATEFFDTSTAGQAAITVHPGGAAFFNDTSTAGSAAITLETDGRAFFEDTSTAGQAAITIDGGNIEFDSEGTAGSANSYDSGRAAANNGGYGFSAPRQAPPR